MAYGSVGAAAGDAFEASILARKKQQAEDIMQAMALRTAESNLETAKQDREISKMVKEQQAENYKVDAELKKQKIHDAKVVDFMKRVPMKGMPWAPKLKQEGIELGVDVDGLIAPGKPAQALRFGGPAPAAVPMDIPVPEPPAALMPEEALPPVQTMPAMGIPAEPATPDVSLVPGDDLRRLDADAAEKEMARRASTEDRIAAAALATQDRQAGRDQSEALRRDMQAASAANTAAIAAGTLGLRREIEAKEEAKLNNERNMKLQGVRNMASDTLRTLDQIAVPVKTTNGKTAYQLTPAMKERLDLLKRGKKYIPGTPAANADAMLQQLQSQLVVELIGEMKAQSRNGATGFGALSGPELDILKAAAGRLSTMQDPAQFLRGVAEIRSKLNRTFQPAAWEKDAAPAAASVQYKRVNGKLVPVPSVP